MLPMIWHAITFMWRICICSLPPFMMSIQNRCQRKYNQTMAIHARRLLQCITRLACMVNQYLNVFYFSMISNNVVLIILLKATDNIQRIIIKKNANLDLIKASAVIIRSNTAWHDAQHYSGNDKQESLEHHKRHAIPRCLLWVLSGNVEHVLTASHCTSLWLFAPVTLNKIWIIHQLINMLPVSNDTLDQIAG